MSKQLINRTLSSSFSDVFNKSYSVRILGALFFVATFDQWSASVLSNFTASVNLDTFDVFI